MSTQTSKDVSCPHCGAVVKTAMSEGINAGENPDLRVSVLDETLFDWKCPKCGYEAQLIYPCLYHDKSENFMIYVVPNGCDCSLRSVEAVKAFPQLEGVTKRVVTSLTELKEKILIFEAGLNDYAVELVKLALAGVASKKYGTTVDKGYFCFADDDRISFSFFLENETEPVQQSTRMDVYRKSLEIVESAGICTAGDEFTAVDFAAAENILREYRGEED
jgi:predicted RNA-binding Zn-ribbon protein involved in translation (DUF1610 family)